MEITEYLRILHVFEKLKNNTRHSYTSSGRKESVAEHSYRVAVMAYFVKDEFPALDIEKVILMGLLHDVGEAFTGDIPCFEKTETDEKREREKINGFIASLPEPYRKDLTDVFREMDEMKTEEAKLYKALDKMEAVIQHNEADISTWLPFEYELQLLHGESAVAFSEYTKQLKGECNRITSDKIQKEKKS